MQSILNAAAVVIDGAIKVLTFAKRFVEKNTPESALILALATAYQSYSTGQVAAPVAFGAAIAALVAFIATESSKDKATTAATPPAQ